MSGPDPAGTGPGDYAEVALRDLVARYVAQRLRGQARLHRDTGLGLDPGEAASTWRLLGPPRPAGPAGTGTSAPARDLDGPGR